jgi:heme-degrading monooxygenase HmoA
LAGIIENLAFVAAWRFIKENIVIVRMWHGRVPTSKADAYREFTNGRTIPDYQSVKGNISVNVLERREGDITHFITLTFWESLEAIKGFAGDASLLSA